MPAIASTIFKIRAHSDFIAPQNNPNILSFRKGQPFYALSADFEKGMYFVSTQFAVPFSRTAVTGMVPMEHFVKVDLLSKDPPISRKKVNKNVEPKDPQPTEKAVAAKTIITVPRVAHNHDTPAVPVRRASLANNPEWNDVTSIPVSFVEVLSFQNQGDDSFCIKVTRGPTMHVIKRSIREFIDFYTIVNEFVNNDGAPAFPLGFSSQELKLRNLELYLNYLLTNVFPTLPPTQSKPIAALEKFFNPKDAQELLPHPIIRRDSGTSQENEKSMPVMDRKMNSKKSNPFLKFSQLVFGH
ncbi:hypothetical protein BC833DRAFT_585493 [Globomyces pollinis-pini]|nr:hypothetical protein BC833DRAFT_585493 [Globomyces pollinis-pini]